MISWSLCSHCKFKLLKSASLLAGTKYYRLSNNLKVELGYPKDISVWTRMKACPAPNQIVGSGDGKNSASVSSVTMATLLMTVVAAVLQVV